jgi:predicted secreted protein
MVLTEDKRSKRVAVIAHCLINQNAKVNGFAFYSSMIKSIVDMLHSKDFGIIQLPCPETLYAGTRRWWHVREQYDTPGYRSHCRSILQPIVDQIAEYRKEGYKIVVIGLDGSPSCGVAASGTSSAWGGAPKIPEIEYKSYPTINKPGIFIEEMMNLLKEEKVEVPPMIGAGFDMPNFDPTDIEKEIGRFLEKVN